jgi:acyl-CoA synthetase (AMP-forming)/AMP-acid ligase II
MFLPSPRNSLEAFDSLLESCNATTFLTASNPYPIVETLISRRSMKKIVIPELDYLLDTTELVNHVPFTKTWEQARMDPFVQVHTSGSTGTPKLQTLKHGNFCCIDAFQNVEPNDIGIRQGNQRTFCPFPPFHVAVSLSTSSTTRCFSNHTQRDFYTI